MRSADSDRPRVRAGIIGCGRMGAKHLRVLNENPEIELVAACDVSPQRLGEIPCGFVPDDALFERYEEMFERVVLDLVVVVTPPTVRVPLVTEALQRGISVLCEKPLAIDLASADRMVEAAQRSDAVLSVHHQFSPTAVLRRCRELIDSGAIGDLIMIRGRAKAGRRAGIELLEIGTHLAEIILALAGRPDWCSAHIHDGERLALPRNVRASLAVAPEEPDLGPVVGTRVAASYGFRRGVLGEMHFVGHEERMPANYGVDIFGTAGQLALRASRHVSVPLWHLPRPMEGTPDQLGDWRAIPVPGGGNKQLVEAFYVELLGAIRGAGPTPCPGSRGRTALEMVQAAYRSHRDGGRRTPLPLAQREHALAGWSDA